MRAVVFANGEPNLPAHWADLVAQADWVIAADGGGRYCLRYAVRPQVVIGDLDSLTPAEVARLEGQGARILRYPRRKDETDLELALLWAARQGAEEIAVLGGLGGRWDQTLANLLLVAHPALQEVRLVFYDGDQRLCPVRRCATIAGHPGDTVSLIPLAGPVEGVTTQGLEYALEEGTLPFGASLGVSNVLTSPQAQVCLRRGLLLCVVIPASAQARLEAAKTQPSHRTD